LKEDSSVEKATRSVSRFGRISNCYRLRQKTWT